MSLLLQLLNDGEIHHFYQQYHDLFDQLIQAKEKVQSSMLNHRSLINIATNIELNLSDIYWGTTKLVSYNQRVDCTMCEGRGLLFHTSPTSTTTSPSSSSTHTLPTQPKLSTFTNHYCVTCEKKKETLNMDTHDNDDRHQLSTSFQPRCSKCGRIWMQPILCTSCHGSGIVDHRQSEQLIFEAGHMIPAHGCQRRFTSNVSYAHKPTTYALLVNIQYIPHDIFLIDTHTPSLLTTVVELSLAESLCGFHKSIDRHPSNQPVILVYDPTDHAVIQHGYTMTISGRGMPIVDASHESNKPTQSCTTDHPHNANEQKQEDFIIHNNTHSDALKTHGDLLIKFHVKADILSQEQHQLMCQAFDRIDHAEDA